jgi:molybdate transport system substrate-binding protein
LVYDGRDVHPERPRMVRRRALFLAALATASAPMLPRAARGEASAAVRVLSAGAVEPGLEAAVRAFRLASAEAARAGAVRIAYATAPQLRERLAAGGAEAAPDLLIAPVALVNELASAGRLAGERMAVGRVGIGVAVRPDAPVPEIGDVAALKVTVEEAEAVIFNRASTGLYLERLFEKLGIAAAVAAKAVRPATGAEVLQRLLAGQGREIGFAPIPEIQLVPAARFVGPLPAEAQNYTTYAASLMPGASPLAAALMEFLAGAAGRAAFATAGIESVP